MTDWEKVIKGLECCNQGERCRECPYAKTSYDPEQCIRGYLLFDALSLLKEFKPRVMTLDEVKQMGLINYAFCEYEEVCYLEQIDSQYITPCSPVWHEAFYDGDDSALEIEYPIMASDYYVYGYVKDYGKTHRCWTRKPTEEMRMKVKWKR